MLLELPRSTTSLDLQHGLGKGARRSKEIARLAVRNTEIVSKYLAQLESDPKDAQVQLNLSASYENLGDVSLQLGQMKEALEFYQKGLQIAQRLAESYLEVDRDRAFAKVLNSPGPPPAGFHRGMTPAEIGALVPRLVAQNPATIDRLTELIAGDPGRARRLGPELLAEILKVAASKDVTGRYNGSRLAA